MLRFGAYDILHELKSGGMGSVLLGRRKGPGAFEQLVAIKTILPAYASTPAVRAMFLDEAKILGGVNHPGIATVHDFGEENGTLYMAMEYVAGVSFRGVMGLDMPPGVAARAIAEACRGLHAAHEVRDPAGNLLNVVHRDISPDNLLLGFDGHVKVIDFGIALVKNRQSPVTELGTVKGKPPYMSPEQVKNEALDRRSDVFSLGVVMHELLTGYLLFDGDSIYAIARKVEHMQIPPPSQVLGKPLPFGLDAAVMNALERDPARRTQSAAAFAEQLEQVIATSGDETLEAWAERTLAEPRDRHRAWLAEVVAGRDAPRPIGRPTGSVTALGPLAFVDQLPAAAPPDPPPPPKVADDSSLDVPPRRSLALPLLLVLALAIGVVVVFSASRSTKVTPDAAIAIADASPADTAVVVVAPDTAPANTAVEPDAARVVVVAPDTRPADAAVEPDAPPDAARVVVRTPADARRDPPPRSDAPTVTPDPVVAGTGTLTARGYSSSNTYLDVVVDGKTIGKTPLLGASLPAGAHLVTLIDPVKHETVHSEKIVIVDGKNTSVAAPRRDQ